MEVTMSKSKRKNRIKTLWQKVWDSSLYVFMILAVLQLLLLAIILFAQLFFYDAFFNSNTDDIAQYYLYIAGFFYKLKNGQVSLYDTSLFAGVSSFASVYYIPLDIFLVFTWLFSYIMPAEMAYFIANFLRIIFGSLILYYVFIRKGYKPLTSFFIALIFSLCGIVEAEWVFPVYLGILCYVPLGMLLVDLFLEKTKKSIILFPLYGMSIVFYDYYIAYMIFAFICVYYLIESHLRSNKFFLFTKDFYIQSLKFAGLILLSLMMSACILIPSAMYMFRETNRAIQSKEPNIWYYSAWISGKQRLNISHYFTMLANIFIPNVPFNLCLVPTGGYIREHASLYMTTLGAIYLVYFFFIWEKKANRLKIWVLLFDFLFLIPLAAMIFTFNNWAYSRWFFIPYMINLYAVGYAMDKYNFKFGNKLFIKFILITFIAAALCFLLYIVIKNPDKFIHYPVDDEYYYPILIGSIIFLGIYLLLTIILTILNIFKKSRASDVIIKLFPLVLVFELLFAGLIDYSSCGSNSIIDNDYIFIDQKEHLKNLVGYNTDNYGERIDLYTTSGRLTRNTNILLGNTNVTSYFQSFYNTALTSYSDLIHFDNNPLTWDKRSNYGYDLLSGKMFNNKYVISGIDCSELNLPDRYYELLDTYNECKYYRFRDNIPFMVYDKIITFNFNEALDSRDFHRDMALLKYGYIDLPTIYTAEENYTAEEKRQMKDKKRLEDKGITIGGADGVINDIVSKSKKYTLNYKSTKYINNEAYKDYTVFDLTNFKYNDLFDNDCIYYSVNDHDIMFSSLPHFYYRNKSNSVLFPTHYMMFYPKAYQDFECEEFLVSKANTGGVLFGFDYDLYDEYIENQLSYDDKKLEIKGSTIKLSFTNTDGKAKVIKLPYAYSDDWKSNNKTYETINVNGGFLGVIIPDGEVNVDIKLNYEPAYFNKSCILSGVGCIIYLVIITPITYFYIKRKRNEFVWKESQL